MPLGSGSPAMGMGEVVAGVPETDARGLTRDHPRGIDIGAWQEQQALLALTITVDQLQTGAFLLEGAESFDATGYQELHIPAAGDIPAIEALPAPGFHFDHWQLDTDGQAEPVTVPDIVLRLSGVTAHTLATAHFAQGDYRRVRVRTHGPGTASVTDMELAPETSLTIDFSPAPGARQGHVNVNGARLEPQQTYTIETGHSDVTIDVFFNRNISHFICCVVKIIFHVAPSLNRLVQ